MTLGQLIDRLKNPIMDNFVAVRKEYNDECLVKLLFKLFVLISIKNAGFLFKLLGRAVDE